MFDACIVFFVLLLTCVCVERCLLFCNLSLLLCVVRVLLVIVIVLLPCFVVFVITV